MPKIAQYDPDQVRSQVVQQPKAPGAHPSAFRTDVSSGLLDIAQAGIDLKKRVDTTSAEEALVKFEREKNNVFFSPDTGYFNTMGRNAYDASASASKALDDLKTKYGDALSPQAKAMFDRAADAHITRGRVDITRHSAKGLKSWEVATIDSQVENTLESASLYWNDPDRLRVQNALGRQAVIDSADMSGVGAETKAENLQTYEAAFAGMVISSATASSSTSGEEAMGRYGSGLEGPDKIKLDAAIASKANTEKTQEDAATAVLTASKLNDQYDSRSDIIAEVNGIKDADLRKKTMTESMAQFNQNKLADKEQEKEYYDNVIALVNEGKSPHEIQAIDPDAWLGMSDSQRNNILVGRHMITDQVLFAQLRSLPVKKKAELNAVEYADRLKPTDLQKLTSEIESAKKGKPGSRVRALSSKSIAAAEGAYGKKSKWTTKSGGHTKRGEQANEFLADLQDAIDDRAQELDRNLTPSEEDEIISEFTRQIVVERSALGFDILASDIEIDLSNAPPTDVRLLNRIIDSTPTIDLNDLVSAYQFLVDEEQPVNATTLRSTYEQGRK